MGTQKCHNICFRGEIKKKILCGYPLLSVAMISLLEALLTSPRNILWVKIRKKSILVVEKKTLRYLEYDIFCGDVKSYFFGEKKKGQYLSLTLKLPIATILVCFVICLCF